MSKVNQLKNKARREEQRENWSRAIEFYTKALDASRAEDEAFADLSLYNRIGDIYLRIGQKNTAVRYYEQAIERYSDQDLHTSAIALCNKVLRILPERSTVFLQLGRLHLATNLIADAREHFHKYANAMRERGGAEAAYEALEELIGLTGDPPTVSLWLTWLADEEDDAVVDERVEAARDALDGQGIDADDVRERLRTGDASGFEIGPAEVAQADPLADAFLSMPEDYPSVGSGLGKGADDLGEVDEVSPAAELEDDSSREAVLEGMHQLPNDLELGALPLLDDPTGELPELEPLAPDEPAEEDAADPLAQDLSVALPELDVLEEEPLAPSFEAEEGDPEPIEFVGFDLEVESDRADVPGFESEAPDPSRPEEAVTAADPSVDPIPFEPVEHATVADPFEGSDFDGREHPETDDIAAFGPGFDLPGREDLEGASTDPIDVIDNGVLPIELESSAPAPVGQSGVGVDPLEPATTASASAEHVTSQPEQAEAGSEPPAPSVWTPEREAMEGTAARLLTDPEAPARDAAEPDTQPEGAWGSNAEEEIERVISEANAEAEAEAARIAAEEEAERVAAEEEAARIAAEEEAARVAAEEEAARVAAEEEAARIAAEEEAARVAAEEEAARIAAEEEAARVAAEEEAARVAAEEEAARVAAEEEAARVAAEEEAARVAAEEEAARVAAEEEAARVAAEEEAARIAAEEEAARVAAEEEAARVAAEEEAARVAAEEEAARVAAEEEAARVAAEEEAARVAAEEEAARVAAEEEAARVAAEEEAARVAAEEEAARVAAEEEAARVAAEEEAARVAAEEEAARIAAEEEAEQQAAEEEEAARIAAEQAAAATEADDVAAETDLEAETISVEVPHEAGPATTDAAVPQDEVDPSRPLAEPRLKTEESPEDAFSDWVKSASNAVLRRALPELEQRNEREKALLVITRLSQSERDDVEYRRKYVDALEQAGRIEEAIEACLVMAGALEELERPIEARDAYGRVLALAPGDARAQDGLERLEGVLEETDGETESDGPKPYAPSHVSISEPTMIATHDLPSQTMTDDSSRRGPQGGGPTIDDETRPYSGVAGGAEASSDFEALLSEFRAELSEKPTTSDSMSRTEFGASLKEMGRLDDAIRELQAAVREPTAPPLAYELLGEAFLEKGQTRIAMRLLEKALGTLGQSDRELLGVLYQLGMTYEQLDDRTNALLCYERIFSVDIDYRDVQTRIMECSN